MIDMTSPMLPELVPYLGPLEKNFLGSGVSGAGADPNGVWDFLIGPIYSSPNFVSREEIRIVIGGVEHPLDLHLQRGRKTGVFYGNTQLGDIHVDVVDFTVREQPWIARMIRVYNLSTTRAYEVSLRTEIVPCSSCVTYADIDERFQAVDKPMTSAYSSIAAGGALSIRQDTTALSYGAEDPNWADRFALIAYTVPGSGRRVGDNRYQLETEPCTIQPNGHFVCGLYHWMYFDEGKPGSACLTEIRGRNVEVDYTESLGEWANWLSVHPLQAQPSQHVADIIESSLVFIRMQQSLDGGFIAGVRRYAFSYLRDGHGAVRGLLSAGHYPEVKRFLAWVDHKCSVFGMIPNSAEMGADQKMLQFVGPEHLASETTAYYILAIRNYYRATGDRVFLRSLQESMRTAMDAQLRYAEEFGWKLMFNGDETERYVPFKDGDIYGGFPAIREWEDQNWSMTATVACIASLEFYIEYLTDVLSTTDSVASLRGKLEKLKSSLDTTFWREELGVHEWCQYRNGSFPNFRVTNYNLLPLWVDAHINQGRERDNALAVIPYINDRGFLPVAPGVNEGFCGHSLGYLLYALAKIGHEKATAVFETLINSGVIGCWGTVAEFYGPGGVANPHNLRIFESGINLEAIMVYLNENGQGKC